MTIAQQNNNPSDLNVQISAEPITVKALISLLNRLDGQTIVVVSGQYGAFQEARYAACVDLCLNVNKLPGFGPHELADAQAEPQMHALAILASPPPTPC